MSEEDAGSAPQVAAAGLVVLALAIQLGLVFRLNVNWDEFYFLSQVHEAARGALDRPLQTFHVHLFGWLARLPLDEMGQVTAGRLVMLACEAATLWLIWATARQLTGPRGALLGVLAFLAAEFTLAHGASFRTDPLATALLMLVLHIVAVRPLGAPQILVAAAAGALAALVTGKAALYGPALLGVAVWRVATAPDRRGTLVRLAAMAGLGLALLAAAFLWHVGQLDPDRERSAVADAGGAWRTAMLAGFLPRPDELAFWAPRSLLALALTGFGLAALWRRPGAAVLGLLCAPLLFLLCYRNAFPYFFPFIIAPAMIVAAMGGERLAARPAFHWAMLGLVAASLLAQEARVVPHDQSAQRAVLAAVRAAFPEPVGYIDRAGMVATYPRRGFLMSGWGIGKYRGAGVPVFDDLLDQAPAPFVIANTPVLEAALHGRSAESGLLPADAALLHDTYIRHWGPIWVAGAELPLDADAGHFFEIRVPGPYTVESSATVRIDGLDQPPGAVVLLDRGRHIAESPTTVRVTLRYGDTLPRPAAAPPAGPVFWGF